MKKLLAFCSAINLILLCLFILNPTVFAVDSQTDERVNKIEFSFSVVDRNVKLTVINNSDMDIMRIQTYRVLYVDNEVKGGTGVYETFPIVTMPKPIVPAGETVNLNMQDVIFSDCNRMVVWVAYIEFADGQSWGGHIATFDSILKYGMKYDVPFETSPPPTTTSIAQFFKGLKKSITNEEKRVIIGLLSFLFLMLLIAVIMIKRSKNVGGGNQIENPLAVETPTNKGRIGEYLAYDKLDEIPGERRLLHNIYIRKPDGTTTEIDCLMIHESGLYVIESKNYKGYIFGSPNNNKWTQVLRKNRHYSLYNPVFQNYGHIKNLMTYLSFETQDRYRRTPIYSIVAFASTADISHVETAGLPANTYVINVENLTGLIGSIVVKAETPALSSEDIDRIYNILLPLTNISNEEKEKHNEYVAKIK